MDWNDLTKAEQREARELAKLLDQSVSQIAKWWPEVQQHCAGRITLTKLGQLTGWKVTPTREDLIAQRAEHEAAIAAIDAALAGMEG